MANPLDAITSIGFIGLGAMGYPMACQLAQKLPPTTPMYVFDVAAAPLQRIAAAHPARIRVASSARDVADRTSATGSGSAVILSIVPEGAHVRAVYLDPETGVLRGAVGSKILVDMSTIDTETSMLVASAVAAVGRSSTDADTATATESVTTESPTSTSPNLNPSSSPSFYDAPVSGGTVGAAKATLTTMLGAADTDPNLPLLRSLLGLMSREIFACGGPTLGLTAKLSNNYLSGLCAIATAEAMNLGMRAGMEPRLLSRVFSASTAQNRVQEVWNPVPGVCPEAPSSRGYAGGFKVQLMRKDFALAVQTAERVGAKLVLGEAGLRTYEAASEDPRCRDLDSRVVYRWLGGREDWEGGSGDGDGDGK